MKNKKKIILSILIILWLIVIFCFSNQNGNTSASNSKSIIRNTITSTIKVTNIKLNDKELNDLVENLNYPIRKIAHFSEYFILAVLVLLLLKEYKFNNRLLYMLTLLFCLGISISDEIHQLFVGRSGEFKDIVIDVSGSILFCVIYKIKQLIKIRKVK